MEISQIAARLGLPEERVAQIAQMVKTQGMPEEQMGPMMQMATSRGLSADEIAETMTSLGVPLDPILRVMRAEGVADDEAISAIRAKLGAQAAGASGKGKEADAHGFDGMEFAKKAGVILFWLAAWELLDRIVDNRLLLAGPIRTAQALYQQLFEPDFWLICAASFGRIAAGFLLALAVGFLLALACYRSRLLRRFVEPIINLLKTIPMASFIIMLLIWVGTQALTVYLAFLIVVPIIYTNVLTGFEAANEQMLEMARVFRLSRWRTFVYVYRPAFMPFLYSSCKLSLGMSWKAGIMAEVLAVPAMSIGKEMYAARTFLNTPDLLAWTVVVMVLSWAFEKMVLWVLRKAALPLGGRLGVRGGDARAEGAEAGTGTNAEADSDTDAGAAPFFAPATGEAIELSGVRKSFGENLVLSGCDLHLNAGDVCCLMAPSGSGKTTLFRCMLGLEQADGGEVRGMGRASMMFQEDRLCERLTPVENVALVLSRDASRSEVRRLLEEVLPVECMEQPVMELSGGMRRRVSLVRAVAYPGTTVVLDEPFTGLDVATRAKTISFILRHKGARTLLVATHGENDALMLGAERVDLADMNKAGA